MEVFFIISHESRSHHIHSQINAYFVIKLKTPVRNINTTSVFVFIIAWYMIIIIIISSKALSHIDLPLIHTLKPRKMPSCLIIFNFSRILSEKKTLFTLMTKDETWNFCFFGTFTLLIRNKMKWARERNELHSWCKWIHIWKSFAGETNLWFCCWGKLNCVAKWNELWHDEIIKDYYDSFKENSGKLTKQKFKWGCI